MKLIYDLSLPDLTSLLAEWGEPAYRARQIWQGLYQHFYNSPDQFTNLPLSLRTKLAENLQFSALTPTSQLASSDKQTIKTLFRLYDDLTIEAILMRYSDPASSGTENDQGPTSSETENGREPASSGTENDQGPTSSETENGREPASSGAQRSRDAALRGKKQGRRTLCISTQVGCAMGCVFCATGQMGFKRHLSSGEIVAQVMYYARLLREQGETVTNVVAMGMGEPFHNYDNTMAAIDLLNDSNGYNFGARRFTVSTVGLVPAIRRFTEERRQVNLAISLHAVDDELRSSMLPVNKKYGVDEVLAACRGYAVKTGRRVTFEWALIRDVNDTLEQARRLANRLRGLLCHVNIIPLNPTLGYPGRPTTRQRAKKFKEILEQAGVACTIRLRRGIEIRAGCGQLAGAFL